MFSIWSTLRVNVGVVVDHCIFLWSTAGSAFYHTPRRVGESKEDKYHYSLKLARKYIYMDPTLTFCPLNQLDNNTTTHYINRSAAQGIPAKKIPIWTPPWQHPSFPLRADIVETTISFRKLSDIFVPFLYIWWSFHHFLPKRFQKCLDTKINIG